MWLYIMLWAFIASALNPIVYFALHRDLRVAAMRLFGGSQQFSWETVTDNTVTDNTLTNDTVTDNAVTDATVTDNTVTDGTVTDNTVTGVQADVNYIN